MQTATVTRSYITFLESQSFQDAADRERQGFGFGIKAGCWLTAVFVRSTDNLQIKFSAKLNNQLTLHLLTRIEIRISHETSRNFRLIRC